ncbi:MAG: hypothetical protein ACJ0QP_04195 [Schleiferiaceae bacterium]
MSKSIKKVLSEILTSGCDERIFLRDETQANKYHLNPVDFEDLFHRGSCTCGTLTPFAEEIAIDFVNNYQESNYSQILKIRLKGCNSYCVRVMRTNFMFIMVQAEAI